MTDFRQQPVEHNELHLRDKKRVAVVFPLNIKQTPNDNSHSSVPETGSVAIKWEDPLKYHLKDLLPDNGQLATKLSNMLNQRSNRVISNWQHLAQTLGVPADISLSFDCNPEHSPTEDLFDYIVAWKPTMTFDELRKTLRSASRNDLVQILNKEGYDNVWKISDNMDFVEKFKDRLDTPKRNMDWKSLASKFGIPKNKFIQFGKPKLGPTKQLFLHVRISSSFKNFTIKMLKDHFEQMNRFDVLKVFERHKVADNDLVKDVLKAEDTIMYELSELLDKEGPMRNWKNLAYRMKIPEHTYESFDESSVHNKNPTKLLLEYVFNQDPNFTVGQFVKSLRAINRNDVVEAVLQGIEEQRPVHTSESIQKTDTFTSENCHNYTSNLTNETKLSHNWDLLSEQERCELQVTQLPEPAYIKICQLLDTTEAFFRDYRMFAEELGIDKITINSLKNTPTHSILVKYKLNIETFLEIMKKIDRYDVVAELEPWLKVSRI